MAISPPRLKRPTPTYAIAELFPMQGDWTEEEYLALDTNRLVELSDGKVEMLEMPTIFHQIIVVRLIRMLDAFIVAHGLGQVLVAPTRVRLRSGKYREPDLVFVAAAHLDRMGELYVSAPDLVAEVISPDDPQRDRVTKMQEYAQAGIPEYWLLDPRTATLEVYALRHDEYTLARRLRAGDELTSDQLPGFTLAVADVFKPRAA
jgi:Uma2 family endonuclease